MEIPPSKNHNTSQTSSNLGIQLLALGREKVKQDGRRAEEMNESRNHSTHRSPLPSIDSIINKNRASHGPKNHDGDQDSPSTSIMKLAVAAALRGKHNQDASDAKKLVVAGMKRKAKSCENRLLRVLEGSDRKLSVTPESDQDERQFSSNERLNMLPNSDGALIEDTETETQARAQYTYPNSPSNKKMKLSHNSHESSKPDTVSSFDYLSKNDTTDPILAAAAAATAPDRNTMNPIDMLILQNLATKASSVSPMQWNLPHQENLLQAFLPWQSPLQNNSNFNLDHFDLLCVAGINRFRQQVEELRAEEERAIRTWTRYQQHKQHVGSFFPNNPNQDGTQPEKNGTIANASHSASQDILEQLKQEIFANHNNALLGNQAAALSALANPKQFHNLSLQTEKERLLQFAKLQEDTRKANTIPSLPNSIPMEAPLGEEATDRQWLSPFHCFVRTELVEVFCAGAMDVEYRKNNKAITLGQVGIRCRFCCKHKYPSERKNRAATYPATLCRIYQNFNMMLHAHFHTCTDIPPAFQQMYTKLKGQKLAAGKDCKEYWIRSAERIGLVNIKDKDGEDRIGLNRPVWDAYRKRAWSAQQPTP